MMEIDWLQTAILLGAAALELIVPDERKRRLSHVTCSPWRPRSVVRAMDRAAAGLIRLDQWSRGAHARSLTVATFASSAGIVASSFWSGVAPQVAADPWSASTAGTLLGLLALVIVLGLCGTAICRPALVISMHATRDAMDRGSGGLLGLAIGATVSLVTIAAAFMLVAHLALAGIGAPATITLGATLVVGATALLGLLGSTLALLLAGPGRRILCICVDLHARFLTATGIGRFPFLYLCSLAVVAIWSIDAIGG